MASINIQFRLPDTYRGELEDYAVRGESYSQTVRRLLLDLLDGGKGQDPVPESSAIPDDLGDRLSAIEKILYKKQYESWEPVDQRLECLEEWIEQYANTLMASVKVGDRLSALEDELRNDRLISLEKELMNLRGRTSAIEKQLDQQQEPQTAILMPKKSDSEAIVTEIAYSHEQAGREWQRNLATVKRWAKDPSKWPTGWIYDGDRQFWVKTP